MTQDTRWIRRRRKLDTFTLLACICARTSMRVPMHFAAKSADASHAAVSKALRRLPDTAFRVPFETLRGDCKRRRARVLALDGSIIPVPQSFRKHGFKTYHGNRFGQRPVGLLSALIDTRTREVVDYCWSENRNEREHARTLFSSASPGDIILMDRGYFSRGLVQAADQAGIKFVMRVRRNACLSVARFCTRPIARNRKVRAAPCEVGSVACRILGTRQDVVRGKYYVFLTNATGSACEVASTYRRRWKVETWFRTLKHTLGFTNLQTTSTKVFRLYLDAIILAYSFHASDTTESLSVAADAPALSIRGEVPRPCLFLACYVLDFATWTKNTNAYCTRWTGAFPTGKTRRRKQRRR